MRPTHAQIEQAAYFRWLRRSGAHGGHGDDWTSAEKDLIFSLNYRYVARHKLLGPPVFLGKTEADAARRAVRCRYCEQSAPEAIFSSPPAVPATLGNQSLRAWDECDDCRAAYEANLAGEFEAWTRTLVGPNPAWPPAGPTLGALKGLVRVGLALLPPAEMHHFEDAFEWVANPEQTLDAAALAALGLGCQVYRTPSTIPAGFVALARRVEPDAPWPYMLVFLGFDRIVLQTHLPLSPRDEDLADGPICGPELSMSLGQGAEHRASDSVYVRVSLDAGVGRSDLPITMGA